MRANVEVAVADPYLTRGTVHQEDHRIGQVVDMQELAAGATAAPDLNRIPALPHGGIDLGEQGRQDVAGKTWLESRSKLSFGPYKFVGITDTKSQPCCRR